LKFSFDELCKLTSCIDRREETGHPVFIYELKNTNELKNTDKRTLLTALSLPVTTDNLESINVEDPFFIINMLKKNNKTYEKCKNFKLEHTTKTVGNWESDVTESRCFTEYSERKHFGHPFLWFYVDEKTQEVLFGPQDEPLRIKPQQFVYLMDKITGNDGFYIEYRDIDDLKKKNGIHPPEWVMKEIITASGFNDPLLEETLMISKR
jgi:hypothetical protein